MFDDFLMKKKIFLFFTIVSLASGLYAQKDIQVGVLANSIVPGVVLDPSMPELNLLQDINYGLLVKWVRDDYAFSSGIAHFTKTEFGVPNNFERLISPTIDPQFFPKFYRFKTIGIPINLDCYVVNNQRFKSFFGLGIYSGWVYSQRSNTRFLNFQDNVRDLEPHEKIPEWFASFNMGGGVSYKLFRHVDVMLRPNVIIQISNTKMSHILAFSKENLRFHTDFGLFYTFQK